MHDPFEPHFYKIKLVLAGVCINASFGGISDVFGLSFFSNVDLYKISSNKTWRYKFFFDFTVLIEREYQGTKAHTLMYLLTWEKLWNAMSMYTTFTFIYAPV